MDSIARQIFSICLLEKTAEKGIIIGRICRKSPVAGKFTAVYLGGPLDEFNEGIHQITPIRTCNVMVPDEPEPKEVSYEFLWSCEAKDHGHPTPVACYVYVPTMVDFKKSLQAAHYGKIWG